MKHIFFLLLMGSCFLIGCRFWTPPEPTLSDYDLPAENAAMEDPQILSLKEDPLWTDEGSLQAMVLSDLHYTQDQDQDHSLVPGIAEAERITDAILAEVIDRHPDVLIMTGDNTNSGYAGDVSSLVSKLARVKEQGIPVIVTTGNHDFDQMDAGEYEASYFPLLDPVDRDPTSLSYTAIIRGVVFLAMDDHNEKADWQGSFSEETMQWLSEMLEKYKGRTVIFLSHHNVLYGAGEADAASHLIQNPDLPRLLQEGGVKLAMTGHMHLQYITEKKGLWEILSGMPFSGIHLLGNLAMGRNRLVYYAQPADFAAYDPALKEDLDRLDQESSQYMDQVFSGLLENEELAEPRRTHVMRLIRWFFSFYHAGTLAGHKEEFTRDPFYRWMIRSLKNYNYGPWMKEMIESTKYSARMLELSW